MKRVVTVKIGEFAGKPFLAIHEVKDDKESEKAVISFGLKKAEAILSALEEIKKFVEERK